MSEGVGDGAQTNLRSSSAGDVIERLKYHFGHSPFIMDRHHLTNEMNKEGIKISKLTAKDTLPSTTFWPEFFLF